MNNFFAPLRAGLFCSSLTFSSYFTLFFIITILTFEKLGDILFI